MGWGNTGSVVYVYISRIKSCLIMTYTPGVQEDSHVLMVAELTDEEQAGADMVHKNSHNSLDHHARSFESCFDIFYRPLHTYLLGEAPLPSSSLQHNTSDSVNIHYRPVLSIRTGPALSPACPAAPTGRSAFLI